MVTEIAPDIFRISTYIPQADLQFNQFLIRDEEPLLFHTGLRAMFPLTLEAVSSLLQPSELRWVAFSHFEADECGPLNEWLMAAPEAEPVCTLTAKIISVDDFAIRPSRPMQHDEVLITGRHRLRFLRTPHVPHAWEAGLVFDEETSVLLCSDLFHQAGDVEPVTRSDVVGRMRDVIVRYQSGPLAHYLPYTPYTDSILHMLADLDPKVCATMHGSTYVGDGARAIRDMAVVLRNVLGVM